MNARQLTLRLALLAVTTACHPASTTKVLAIEPTWLAWSDQAFSRASQENKLILISLQAGFCHWCHVMNATTYRDPRVLALLAEHFVVLRADEASRPDLRERYAAWGWPATALLTPDARPIVNLRGYQRPAEFAALLEQLVDKQRRGQPLEVKTDAAPVPSELSDTRAHLRAELAAAYDPREGGWGTPQKYPYAAPIEHALWIGDRERALRSLAGYRQLIDPVAGGMYQYSLGGVWTEPHYEKLLSIQAGAIANFSAAYRASGDAALLDSAQRIAEYTLRTLRAPDGAFYASQAADLGNVGEVGYLEGKLYYARDATQRGEGPALDRHVYANLNGLIIVALCELYRADGQQRWLTSAREALAAVSKLARGAAYRHSADDEVLYLSDQVELARASYALAAAESKSPQAATATLDWLEANLRDPGGGFYSHAQVGAVGVFAERTFPRDDNARLARLLLSRSHVEDEPRFAALARDALSAVSAEKLGRQAGELLIALEQLESPYLMFSVVGNADDPATYELHRAAYRAYVPQGIVSLGTPEHSRYPYPGRAAVYLCSDTACSSPITDVARLAPELAAFMAAEARP